jgi:hypothetical protein
VTNLATGDRTCLDCGELKLFAAFTPIKYGHPWRDATYRDDLMGNQDVDGVSENSQVQTSIGKPR